MVAGPPNNASSDILSPRDLVLDGLNDLERRGCADAVRIERQPIDEVSVERFEYVPLIPVDIAGDRPTVARESSPIGVETIGLSRHDLDDMSSMCVANHGAGPEQH